MSCCDKPKHYYSGGHIIPPFWNFTNFTPSIPKLYWNVRSQEQRLLNLFELMNKVICYADMLGENVDELIERMDALEQKLSDPEFIEQYIEVLQKWLDEHMPDIIADAIRIVYFGLTLDGYFVAYIPEGNAWDDVMFDTGGVYDSDAYGRLMLYYKTDTSSEVWQSDPPQGDTSSLIAQLSDLERRVTRNETTLYTPIEEGE